MMKVTAVAANAPAMAALQENGVRPASDAAGTITSRSIIAVSVKSSLFEVARVASSSHTLNSDATFEFHRRSARAAFLGKINHGTPPF
jgi:hypothetical protein